MESRVSKLETKFDEFKTSQAKFWNEIKAHQAVILHQLQLLTAKYGGESSAATPTHQLFIKMTSPISLEKSNQVVLKLQSFHEEKIRAREKVDEFFSQYRPRNKPKSDPCLRPKLAKFKKVCNKHHNDKQREASVPILGFQSLLPATRLLLDSTCIQGSAFFVSNVQKSNCRDYGYGSVKERFQSPDFSISDGIAIDFSIRFDVGFILDAKRMLIPTEVVGVRLGHNVFDELPHSTNNCVLQLGYRMPISDSGGTLLIGHFTSKYQVADVYNSKFLVCNVEFLQNCTTNLRDDIELVASNFGDKESDETRIMAVGFVGLSQFMKAQPIILENECQKEWVGMYAHHVFVGMQQTADMASLKFGFHELIRDKGGTIGQRLFTSKSKNKDCVLGSDCSKVVKCEVSFDSSMIIHGEYAGKLGLHHLEACMDKNRKKKRKFILYRFETGWCVVLDREYYKGIRDKGGGSKFKKQTSKMMCMRCLNIQPVGPICSTPSCNGLSMTKYYCYSCKLFDVGRSVYHCPFCNLCRVGKGLGIDYFHYMKCNCCLSISIVNYKCREKCLEANCPICNDFLFTSTSSIRALPCGHLMHVVCLEAFPRSHTSEHHRLLQRLKKENSFSDGENCVRILLVTLSSDAKFLPSMEVAHPSSTCKGWVKRINIAVIMLIKWQHYFQIRFCRCYQALEGTQLDMIKNGNAAATEVLVMATNLLLKMMLRGELYHELKLRFSEIVNL